MPAGVLLAMAIALEIVGTLALRGSDGFTRPLPTAVVVATYVTAFWLLAIVLRTIPVSTTYAIWSAVGTAAVAAIGILALGEPAGALKIASIALIIAGVVGLNLAGSAH